MSGRPRSRQRSTATGSDPGPSTRTALGEVALRANRAADVDAALRAILDATVATLGFDAGGIYLLDGDSTASVRFCHALPPSFLSEVGTIDVGARPYSDLFLDERPLFLEHYERLAPGRARRWGFLSVASIPLAGRDRVLGALNVASKRRHRFPDDQRSLLVGIGREAGALLDRMSAEQSVRKSETNLRALVETSYDLFFVVDMQGHVLFTNEAVRRVLGYESGEALGMAVEEFHPPERREEARRIVRGMIEGRTDTCELPLLARSGEPVPAETRMTTGRWNGADVLFCSCRPRAAADAPNGLTTASLWPVEHRKSPRIAIHQRRVAQLTELIALELELPASRTALAMTAAEVHDVGKAGLALTSHRVSGPSAGEVVPDRHHPQFGYEMLRSIGVADPIPLIVLEHHERHDGTGYPRGLSGDQIETEAAIIAVADAAENLLSGRQGSTAAHDVGVILREQAGAAFEGDAAMAGARVLASGCYQPPLCLESP